MVKKYITTERLEHLLWKIKELLDNFSNHITDTNNPHSVTMSDVGVVVLTQTEYNNYSGSKTGKLFFIK